MKAMSDSRLCPVDRAVLDLERSWWQYEGAKGARIRTELAMSPSAYYRRLGALIDRPDVLAADPLLVRRLRRARAQRRRRRYEGISRNRRLR